MTLRLRPIQILEAVEDLGRRVRQPKFIQYLTFTAFGADDPAKNQQLVSRMFTALSTIAEPFLITDDMTHVVKAAADALDDSDILDPTLAPSPYGIARFNTPLPVLDARGREMLAHWMMWQPVTKSGPDAFGVVRERAGIAVSSWNDTDDPDDIYGILTDLLPEKISQFDAIVGRWGLLGVDFVPSGSQLGPPATGLPAEAERRIVADGDTPNRPTNMIRYAHALWLLLGQTIVETERQDIRPRRKGPRRMNLPKPVTVVKLRHIAKPPSGEPADVHWRHRWYVRGHWAWRQCGKDHPMAQEYDRGHRVRLWISPYVKGPDGAPFVQSEKVNVLAR